MKGLLMAAAGLAFIAGLIPSGFAQEMLTVRPVTPIVCYQSFDNRHDHIPPSRAMLRQGARTKSATFEVEYINFPSDNKAKEAFEYAVAIWENELSSSVPVRIRAEWRPLSAGVLGQAIWGSAHANFAGAHHLNVFYPVALAEKITGREINDPSEPDIFASFNSNASWYFGTDGNTPAGKMDLVTIVLHEIAHGLGFTDTYEVNGSQGSVGLESGGVVVPFIFDLFVENQASKNLLRDFQSPSQALATELQSAKLFFNSPLASDVLEGVKPKLYAPSPFNGGSSISHLDEQTFNGDQDANRLMTPHISFAESIHQPGGVLLGTLADMGWIHTLIEHEPLKDSERHDGNPYPLSVRIVSDQGYKAETVKLHYTTNGVNYVSVAMSPGGAADEFVATLPGTTTPLAYAYYVSVEDVDDRSFTSPGIMHEVGGSSQQGTHYFRVGPDAEAPNITHQPVRYLGGDSDLVLNAIVTDNQGIAEVVVEYRINDGAILTEVMEQGPAPDEYVAQIGLPALSAHDEIRYRIIARDVAVNENIRIDPLDDFYIVDITGVLPVQEAYVNNFNKPTTDFFGDHFSIITPQGFSNGAIHTNHPYANGSGPNYESHYTYQLQIPIRIGEQPFIKFDEIVLVEPGENGSGFGDEDFYDYVVVEGSVDGGLTWKPFAEGYDSRADNAWIMRYESNMSNDNSHAKGDSTLFRTRIIDMLESGAFSEGDEVLIRFRLFADQLAYGWGWAIDNLQIQSTVTGIEENRFVPPEIYPVPVKSELIVDFGAEQSPSTAVEILDPLGRTVFSHALDTSEGPQMVIDVRAFENGFYLLRVHSRGATHIQKFLKTD